MAISLTTLERETWRLLAEATDTPLGELTDGSGTPVASATAGVDDYLAQAARRIARTCLAIRKSGTLALLPNQTDVLLKTITVTGGYVLWALTSDPLVGTAQLKPANETALRAAHPDYRTATASAVTHHYELGTDAIGIYPGPTGGGTLAAEGLAVPPAPSGSDAIPWIEDGLGLYLLPRYAATVIGKANQEDERLAAKAATWANEWVAECIRLKAMLPSSLAYFFREAILPPQGIPAPKGG